MAAIGKRIKLKRGRPIKMSVVQRAESLDAIISAHELAELLGMSTHALYKQIERCNGRKDLLPRMLPRVGRSQYRFLRDDVVAWSRGERVA